MTPNLILVLAFIIATIVTFFDGLCLVLQELPKVWSDIYQGFKDEQKKK